MAAAHGRQSASTRQVQRLPNMGPHVYGSRARETESEQQVERGAEQQRGQQHVEPSRGAQRGAQAASAAELASLQLATQGLHLTAGMGTLSQQGFPWRAFRGGPVEEGVGPSANRGFTCGGGIGTTSLHDLHLWRRDWNHLPTESPRVPCVPFMPLR